MTQTTQCPQGGDSRVKRSQDGEPCKHAFIAQHVHSVAVGTSKQFWPVLGEGVGKAFRKEKKEYYFVCGALYVYIYVCLYVWRSEVKV